MFGTKPKTAAAEPAPTPGVGFDQLDRDITAGLKFDSERRSSAWDNRQFFDGRFAQYPTRKGNAPHKRTDFRRTSRFMRRVIHALTANLYKRDPLRQLADPQATDWLEKAYRSLGMAAKWAKADQLALVADVAAFQFYGKDPAAEVPIGVHLWAGDQLAVWLNPDDQVEPVAVATVDTFDATRRVRLYTPEEVAEYRTAKLRPDQTAGGSDYKLVSRGPTPYRDADGKGFLPFAFVHAEEPCLEFWTEGLGDYLREANDLLNFRLDRLGDAIRFMRPWTVAEGIAEDWTPPADPQPSEILRLPAFVANVGESSAATNPTLRIVAPELGLVDHDWADLNSYIDHTLECAGIPPGTIRMVGSAASGVALLIEQAPLLAWAEGRRKPYRRYEEKAAAVACKVAAARIRSAGGVPADWLDAAGADPGLSLEWPNLYVQLPPERDRADEFELSLGITSKLRILMERSDLTRDQALARLAQVEADNADLDALGIDPAPPAAVPPPAPGDGTPEPLPAD